MANTKMSVGTPSGDTMARLHEARSRAEAAHQQDDEHNAALAGQLRHVERIIDRLTRRRDHLLAAGEENPSEARQAAELAATAERLRKEAERSRRALASMLSAAAEGSRKSGERVKRIDAAAGRLEDAVKSLELVRLERASRERISELERTSLANLQQLGRTVKAPRPSAFLQSEAPDLEVDGYVREITRLTYEAEALAALQRKMES